MSEQKSELIWAGRIHLGDEPGVYGNAAYTGLVTEFPITLTKCSSEAQDDIELILIAEDVQVYDPYPGHQVTVIGFKEIAESDPPHWEEVELGVRRMKEDTIRIRPDNTNGIKFLSVRVRIDTSVAPGLYDEFVLLRVELQSTTHYASLGFQCG
jgi:hypothetical protein